MKVKILIGVLLFLIAVNLATIGSYVYFRFTGPPPGHLFNRELRGRRPFNRGPGGPPELRLNRRQRQQLFKQLSEFRRETQSQRRKINRIERKTFQLIQQDLVPVDSVNANLKEISDIRLEISRHIIKKMIAAKSYLTPKQQHEFYNAIMRARAERPNRPMSPPNSPLP